MSWKKLGPIANTVTARAIRISEGATSADGIGKKAATMVDAEVAASFQGEVNEGRNRSVMSRMATTHRAPMRPALHLVSSRCMDRVPQTRLPRAARSIHMVLIVDNGHARSVSLEAGT